MCMLWNFNVVYACMSVLLCVIHYNCGCTCVDDLLCMCVYMYVKNIKQCAKPSHTHGPAGKRHLEKPPLLGFFHIRLLG